jgi:hypothetical protein
VVAFQKLADVDMEGKYFNDAAYQMTNADLLLPLALRWVPRGSSARLGEVTKPLRYGWME